MSWPRKEGESSSGWWWQKKCEKDSRQWNFRGQIWEGEGRETMELSRNRKEFIMIGVYKIEYKEGSRVGRDRQWKQRGHACNFPHRWGKQKASMTQGEQRVFQTVDWPCCQETEGKPGKLLRLTHSPCLKGLSWALAAGLLGPKEGRWAETRQAPNKKLLTNQSIYKEQWFFKMFLYLISF